MIVKKYILHAALMLLFACVLTAGAAAYSARSMVLTEKSTGTVLLDINCDQPLPMASTTKIMTALVTLENAELSERVKIPAQAAGVEGSSMYLTAGETLTVEELLYGLMLTSGNDAATALAIHVGGSEQAFVDLMNRKARELGLTSTQFANPSGLPDDRHYTTARELALITGAALDHPVFAKLVSSKSASVSYRDTPGGRKLQNHNKLLTMYDKAIGVKTGFTKKAGRCLVSAAENEGVVLICVTLNDGDDWNDHITAHEYGFSVTRKLSLAKAGEIEVALATPDGTPVTAVNERDVATVVFDPAAQATAVIRAERFVYAPRKKGDAVGSVSFYVDGNLAATEPLVLTAEIPAPPLKKQLFFTRIIQKIKDLF